MELFKSNSSMKRARWKSRVNSVHLLKHVRKHLCDGSIISLISSKHCKEKDKNQSLTIRPKLTTNAKLHHGSCSESGIPC